jgi:HK97 family phage major capsid protein
MALSVRWKTNEAIMFGTGNGTPLGIFTGAASVVQAKDAGQSTLTLSTTNLLNMFSRLPPGSYSSAIWQINNTVIPALGSLTLGNYPIFLPVANPSQGGLAGGIQWTLLGRPVLITQHAKAFTSQGDVILTDLGYYQTITKSEGIQTATSMHLYFDADAMAFRVTFRVDGQPKIAAPISPANGSTTLSPFVQLAAR